MPYWFDGNNLMGQPVATARADSKTRRNFMSVLSNFQKAGGGRFLIYFDGDDAGGSMPPRGLQVRYSAPLSADEAVLRRLHEIQSPSEVIVVSNDRGLRMRCRDAGAKTMTWQEFCSKMKARSARAGRQSDKTEEVDVEEWIRYFGLDKTSV